MTILGISYYDVYYGIEIVEEVGINVTTGLYPFVEDQKFVRGTLRFKVVEFKYAPERDILYNEKIVTSVVFETLKEPVEQFTIPILKVMESIKEGRTKFYSTV